MRLSNTILALLALGSDFGACRDSHCKCTPHDSCWPSAGEFEALNKTVSGRLIQGVSPAAVCYPDEPDYDEAACETVRQSWHSYAFHAADPISIAWPYWANNPCPPIYPNKTSVTGDVYAGLKGCKIGGYPAYALNSSDVADIQAVVKFANEKHVRLNVKSTGHSFLGRSTALGSISIWTHHIKGAEWHDDFMPERCQAAHEPQTAVTLGAGAIVREVYEFADSHDSVVVGGAAPDVGMVGWFTGAGHGPLSATYGMGADNVLQIKMVTPTGDFITANTCQNSDLFWAMRGGGGGTFGVVTEVTMRAYPSPQTTLLNVVITALESTTLSEYFDVVAEVFSHFPRLKLGGMQGYNYLSPPGFGGASTWTLGCRLIVYDEPDGTVEALFSPIQKFLDSRNGSTIWYTVEVEKTPDFFTLWEASATSDPCALSGGAMGSRLLPASAFEDVNKLSAALQEFANPPPGGPPTQIQAHLVANSNRRGNDIAMNPVWRDTVIHLIVVEFFPDWYDLKASRPYIERVEDGRVGQLRKLAPESGAYINEADPFDDNWQHEFFNSNYDRLKKIKEKHDPQSVLWCRSCVGSELWEQGDSLNGRLCRARS